jgi:hypothetical protein
VRIARLKLRNRNDVLEVDVARLGMMYWAYWYCWGRDRGDDDVDLGEMGKLTRTNWNGDVDHMELDNLVVRDRTKRIDVRAELVGAGTFPSLPIVVEDLCLSVAIPI